MTTMTGDPKTQETRHARLTDLIGDYELYDEATTAMIRGSRPTTRWLLKTAEGGGGNQYEDNPNFTCRGSLDEIRRCIEAEANESPSWTPLGIWDLDSGAEIGWKLRAELDA